ncbi:MAG TPA: SseB family protein [Candidatus Binatia bacterium]|nr:SseB family protein [Candidatus Binatia bacterium]
MLVALLALAAAAQGGEAKAPVDVNKPVENPALVRALERASHEKSTAAKEAVLGEVRKATYLAAILSDELKTSPGKTPGSVMIEAGSLIKFIGYEKDGKNYLPLFTDWYAMRAYTKQDVNAFILRAPDAWSFVLNGNFAGVVINPAGSAFTLERPMIESLQKTSK